MTLLRSAQRGTALLVHGAGGGGWEFDLWREAFTSKRWRFVAPDLEPGRSGLAATTFADYVAQTTSQAADLGDSLGRPNARDLDLARPDASRPHVPHPTNTS